MISLPELCCFVVIFKYLLYSNIYLDYNIYMLNILICFDQNIFGHYIPITRFKTLEKNNAFNFHIKM